MKKVVKFIAVSLIFLAFCCAGWLFLEKLAQDKVLSIISSLSQGTRYLKCLAGSENPISRQMMSGTWGMAALQSIMPSAMEKLSINIT